ncbi:MAG TPA: SUMF1/EgtB/PvdO family nonheme iron enzyme, partial [Gemmatimonadales bacterium]|nr:SUMF1/EgtB/PvdO family nonheme iron enzyme [Gemmatimonadales bacterium]
LAKDPAARYPSAAEMRAALVALAAPLAVAPAHRRLSAAVGVTLVALVLAAGGWMYHRTERRSWARERALPAAAALQQRYRWLAADQLLRQAGSWLPGDTTVARLQAEGEREIAVSSTPAGATVEIADYLAPDTAWVTLGVTPIDHVRIPRGYFRWRLTPRGGAPQVTAPPTDSVMRFALDSAAAAPAGSVWVPGGEYGDFIDFTGWIGPFHLPPVYVDRYEVTNREYQRFVDSGGYRKPEYWPGPFADEKRAVTWEEAMALFRDSSGRSGPSTWQGGHYQAGRGDYPVSGVSWFEALAYARWVGRSLPTMAQWYHMAPSEQMLYAILASNIGRDSLAPVGAFRGVGPYGTYDMGGNVREWVSNSYAGRRHFLLGGAWNSQPYLYSEPEALSPFDRSPENGVRTVLNLGPLLPEVAAPVKVIDRDFAQARPASAEVFRTYQGMYAYDHTPLKAKLEGVARDSSGGRIEHVSFDAAYGHQRVPAYLFLPPRVHPPYQAVLFFPSARVLGIPDSRTLGDTAFFADIVRSGRAVLYPVYQGTYERSLPDLVVGAAQEVELRVQRYRDAARSLDYLASRGDIDSTRLAYLGVSMGAAEGVIYTTLLQDRLKAVLLLDGGFFLDQPSTGGDQVDFAPRLKRPVLMVNGRYDFSFSLDRAQLPLFRMLGTPAADKQHVILETPHDVSADRAGMKRATLAWLDRYLGRVE